MNQNRKTPRLNHKALASGARTLDPQSWAMYDRFPNDSSTARRKFHDVTRIARIVTAYLDVTNPIITNTTQLENLPIGTSIIDNRGDEYKLTPLALPETIWYQFGDDTGYANHDIALPATVLNKPEQPNA